MIIFLITASLIFSVLLHAAIKNLFLASFAAALCTSFVVYFFSSGHIGSGEILYKNLAIIFSSSFVIATFVGFVFKKVAKK